MVDRFECFGRAKNYETAKNYRLLAENFKIGQILKVMTLLTLNKLQATV